MKKIIIIAMACVLLVGSVITTVAISHNKVATSKTSVSSHTSTTIEKLQKETSETSEISANSSTVENASSKSVTTKKVVNKTTGNSSTCKTTKSVSGTTSVVYKGVTYTYPSNKAERDAQARVIAKQIAAQCTEGSQICRADKASKLVYEYCKKCVYDSDYKTTIFREAYGVFIGHIYTCAGSASAMGMVLDEMGIEWLHVNEGKGTHQWCAASMDGKDGWADAYIGQVGLGDYIFHNYYDASLGMTVNEKDAIIRAENEKIGAEIRDFCTNELGLTEVDSWEYRDWEPSASQIGGTEWQPGGDNIEAKECLKRYLNESKTDPIFADYDYKYFSISISGRYVEIIGKHK